jgi:hypothetical protein
MKNLLILAITLLISSNCFSQEKKLETKRFHKLNYEQYISHYGVDDTSIAIIDIYFDKRRNNAGGKMSFLPLTAGIAVITPPLGVSLIAISSPLFVSGLITRQKYSRKNLLKALIKYQNKNVIAVNLKQRVDTYLEIEEEIYQEELADTRFASLKAIN